MYLHKHDILSKPRLLPTAWSSAPFGPPLQPSPWGPWGEGGRQIDWVGTHFGMGTHQDTTQSPNILYQAPAQAD